MKTIEQYLDKANRPFQTSIRMEDEFVSRTAALEAIQEAQFDIISELIERIQKEFEYKNHTQIWHVGETLKSELI